MNIHFATIVKIVKGRAGARSAPALLLAMVQALLNDLYLALKTHLPSAMFPIIGIEDD